MKIASLPEDRWSSKITEWNPASRPYHQNEQTCWKDKEKVGQTKSTIT